MNPLLRLYPREWRERYGDELAAILEERPAGPSLVLDVIRGALDAHVRAARGRGSRGTGVGAHRRRIDRGPGPVTGSHSRRAQRVRVA